jgi:uncharacterized protein
MLRKILSYTAVLLLLSTSALRLSAQDIPERPSPPRLVNDYTGTLEANEIQSLESKLVQFNDSSSTQIVIAIVSDFGGTDKSDFAYKLGEKWGVGQKGKDNGIVIVVKPTGGQGERGAYIAVGYGLEGVIPDITAKRIVDVEMIPNFKSGNYYAGLNSAVDRIMGLARHEFSATAYMKKTQKSPFIMLIPFIIIGIIMLLIRVSRARSYSVGKNIPFWTSMFLLSNMGGRGSGWNSFSSGSGSFGGGGGGFGGFGGGSFGGGGAGGSW